LKTPVPIVQRWMIGILFVAMLVTGWYAIYPSNTVLQHLPTAVLLVAAVPLLQHWPLGNASAAAIFAFFMLHALGAQYSYSFVPYDAWLRAITGTDLSSHFVFVRNHYDRLVHFCFGLLAIGPVREIARRHLGLSSRGAAYIAPEFVFAFSACYEIFEWTLAVTMSPADAEAYNGQQGDPFDSQKDMAMAALGAIVGTMLFYLRGRFIAGRSRQ